MALVSLRLGLYELNESCRACRGLINSLFYVIFLLTPVDVSCPVSQHDVLFVLPLPRNRGFWIAPECKILL